MKPTDISLEFHHVGVACSSLKHEARRFELLGYNLEGEEFSDPVQGVRGCFMTGGGPRMELLMPEAEDGVLTPWLKSGVKLYHLAYIADNQEKAIDYYRNQRAKLVVAPVPAIAFGGRHICFLMLPNMLLIELIQQELKNIGSS